MGLFDKKFCSICGQKVGTIFHRKLEDGFLCKDCAGKLSPFFSERRSSTAEEIREQLAYREENRKALESFHITRTLGKGLKIHLDEDQRKFVITGEKNVLEANPDLLDLAQVTAVDVDVSESQTEAQHKDAAGKMIGYVPPRYTFKASVQVIVRVNHPYFDTVTIPLDSSITLNPGNPLPASLKPMPKNNREFMENFNMANEIRRILLGARQQSRNDAAAANKPRTAVCCPNCGATTIPDLSGCCEYCGGPVGQ